MVHIALHFVVPAAVALLFYRSRWWNAFLVLIATMAVDLDHLLADPIYDPERCSIGFHPLHTLPAIVIYVGLYAIPLIMRRQKRERWKTATLRLVHLAGLGLLIHMVLDGIDCLI